MAGKKLTASERALIQAAPSATSNTTQTPQYSSWNHHNCKSNARFRPSLIQLHAAAHYQLAACLIFFAGGKEVRIRRLACWFRLKNLTTCFLILSLKDANTSGHKYVDDVSNKRREIFDTEMKMRCLCGTMMMLWLVISGCLRWVACGGRGGWRRSRRSNSLRTLRRMSEGMNRKTWWG